MIRLNLLPSRGERRKRGAAASLVALGVVLAGALVAVVAVDGWLASRLDAQLRSNSAVEGRISRIRGRLQHHDEVRADIEELERRREVVAELEAARSGPAAALVELARLMSPNGRPTIDHSRYLEVCRDRPGSCLDPDWDGRRVWIRGFREEDHEVEIQGRAVGHDDVAELLRRLALSDYFDDVRLVATRSAREAPGASPSEGEAVAFEIRCRVSYGRRATGGTEA